MNRFLCLFFTLLSCSLLGKIKELPMVVVIASYKNEKWVEANLHSVLSQKYNNFRVIYIDDASPDKTYDLAKQFIEKHKKNIPVELIHNRVRKRAMHNQYDAIHSCRDDEIIVTVDGDDWLPHKNVLTYLNSVYSKKEVWLTHGTYQQSNGKSGHSFADGKDVIDQNSFRDSSCPSHLRTFYAWLFKRIKKEDLMYEGEFLDMTGDLAMMFPMMEMAGDRQAFISRVLYIYNINNPISVFRKDHDRQLFLDRWVRALPKYEKLSGQPNLVSEKPCCINPFEEG